MGCSLAQQIQHHARLCAVRTALGAIRTADGSQKDCASNTLSRLSGMLAIALLLSVHREVVCGARTSVHNHCSTWNICARTGWRCTVGGRGLDAERVSGQRGGGTVGSTRYAVRIACGEDARRSVLRGAGSVARGRTQMMPLGVLRGRRVQKSADGCNPAVDFCSRPLSVLLASFLTREKMLGGLGAKRPKVLGVGKARGLTALQPSPQTRCRHAPAPRSSSQSQTSRKTARRPARRSPSSAISARPARFPSPSR